MTVKTRLPFAVPLLSVWLALALAPTCACAQPVAADSAEAAGSAGQAEESDFRDTSGYPFSAIAQVTADLQNVAYAMQLRDYCADRRLSDDFVRDRLRRFSRISGRSETCQSLLDY